MFAMGVINQISKLLKPFDLFFDCEGNLENTGTFSGVTPSVVGASVVVYSAVNANDGQSAHLTQGGILFNGTTGLANGNTAWECGFYWTPSYNSFSIFGKYNAANTQGWKIFYYYGCLYANIVGGAATALWAANVTHSVKTKIKIVYTGSQIFFYANDALLYQENIVLTGYSDGVFSIGTPSSQTNTTVAQYFDDFYFKVTP